jgi:tetratricopeptide (TPR) repeat protein
VRTSIFAPVLGALVLLSDGGTRAQPSPDEARLEEARTRYSEGAQLFQRRRFSEAVIAFERSYRLRPHPATLYNAAEARMRAGDNAGALEQLRTLLAMTDPAPEAEMVTRARGLAEQMGEQNLQPAVREQPRECPACPTCPQAPECPPPPPPERIETERPGPLAWALAGGAVGLTALGAGFFAVAVDNASTFRDPGASQDLQLRLRDQGEVYRVVGLVGLLLGVGSAVGAVWLFTHPPAHRAPAASAPMAGLRLDVGLQGLSLSGRF